MSILDPLRHQEVFQPHVHNKMPITIIGVGATGSRVFAALVELGLTNITLFDDDIVERHNLANQIFLAEHVGISKVAACTNWYLKKTASVKIPAEMVAVNGRLPDPNPHIKPRGIVFLLTDTMSSRKEIYEKCLKDNPNVFLVIETRMASSYGNILTFCPQSSSQSEQWLSTLIDDDKAEVSTCGSSISVGATASIIANLAVWQYMLYCIDPEAPDSRINLTLKPFGAATK